MKFVYRDTVAKEIKNAIASAKKDGKRLSAVQLSKDELEELKADFPGAEFGVSYKGVLLSAGS